MVFEAICPELDFSDETIQKIQGIIDTNKKEIRLAYSDIEVSNTSILIRIVRAEIEVIRNKSHPFVDEIEPSVRPSGCQC
jgi:hypothetical protein